ncbi:MAG: hypothetical protein ACREKE_03370 [bacterium]
MTRLLSALVCVLVSTAPAWAYSTYGTYVPPESLRAPQALTPSVSTGPGSWSFALRAGAALPLGSQSKYNGAGGMGGADVLYQMTSQWDLDLLGLYAAMPYTAAGGGSSRPLAAEGLGLKADYQIFNSNQTTAWIGAGVGLMGQQSTQHNVISEGFPVVYDQQPESSAGLSLLAALGAAYAFYPQWTVKLELLVLSLDAQGGTSNNLLAAIPDLSVEWTY